MRSTPSQIPVHRSFAAVARATFRAAPGRATSVLLLGSSSAVADALFAWWTKLLVDAAVAGDLARAMWAVGGMGATLTVSIAFGVSGFMLRVGLEERVGLFLDEQLIERTAGIPGIEQHERPDYLDQIELLRTSRSDLSQAVGAFMENIAIFVRLGGTIVLLGTVHPILLLLPVFGLPSLWAGARGQSIVLAMEEKLAELRRRAKALFDLGTTPSPAKEVRIFALDGMLTRRHDELCEEIDRVATRARVQQAALSSLGWSVFGLGYATALGFVVWRFTEGDPRITIGSVLLAVQLAAQVNNQVSAVVRVAAWLMRTLRTAGRFVWLMDYADEHARAPVDPAPVPERLRRGIELRDVGFRYPGTDADVLTDVDLLIPAGSTVAVVGDNGAGKSTIVKLLCRFYEPSSGAILVDGVDLSRIDAEQWRAHLAAGFQDFARFELLARETVGVGNSDLMEDVPSIEDALARANASDVIEALPHGLETQLGKSFDDGVELSGGQWQKLALGRAMMRRAPLLLLLDEPTASLDAQTEHLLFEQYAGAAKRVARETGAITVFVSHRFSTVRMADLIAVVDGGRVAEFGAHDALVAAGGLYAELYELQARAYR